MVSNGGMLLGHEMAEISIAPTQMSQHLRERSAVRVGLTFFSRDLYRNYTGVARSLCDLGVFLLL